MPSCPSIAIQADKNLNWILGTKTPGHGRPGSHDGLPRRKEAPPSLAALALFSHLLAEMPPCTLPQSLAFASAPARANETGEKMRSPARRTAGTDVEVFLGPEAS